MTEEDIPVLLSMGKENLYVWEKTAGMLHEDEAAFRLCGLCIGEHMHCGSVKEGKVELFADADGFCPDGPRGSVPRMQRMPLSGVRIRKMIRPGRKYRQRGRIPDVNGPIRQDDQLYADLRDRPVQPAV